MNEPKLIADAPTLFIFEEPKEKYLTETEETPSPTSDV